MAKKDTLHPWQQIEEQAFHAFREWPLWLVLRERELAGRANPSSAGQATVTETGQTDQSREK